MAKNVALKSKRSTYEKVLETSLPLFVARGVDGVSLADLARASGSSNAAVLYHFKTSEDVFLAQIDRWAKAGLEHTNLALSKVLGESAESVIKAFMEATLKLLDDDALFAKLTLAIFLGAQSNALIKDRLDRILEGGHKRIIDILLRANFAPGAARRDARYLHSLIVGALTYEMLVDPASAKEFRKQALKQFEVAIETTFRRSESS